MFDKNRVVLGHRPLIKIQPGGGAPLEHRAVAVDEDRWLFGVRPVDLGNFATTLSGEMSVKTCIGGRSSK